METELAERVSRFKFGSTFRRDKAHVGNIVAVVAGGAFNQRIAQAEKPGVHNRRTGGIANVSGVERGDEEDEKKKYAHVLEYTPTGDFAIVDAMDTIFVLPDLVVDQIAAGEVLEHPASAVKEMLENSLDAGARQINVEIEAGGLQRIQIEDDGCGMSRNDALICLKRHATSKIRSADDLQKLMTMGFRGEALAAIASVSQLELRTSNGKETTRLCGSIVEPCARNRGTTIEIRSLFSNTPARLKFQKSPSACAAAVLRTVQTISLAHPDVGFSLLSNGKLVFSCKATDWKRRAEEVLGPFAHEVKGPGVRGLVGQPQEAKLNRSGQTLFVNQRPITSHLVSRAVKEAFGTRIGEALFPVFLLFIDVAPEEVDVNVHPQKKEVRFREEGKLYQVVRAAVEAVFAKEEPKIAPMPWEFTPATVMPFVIDDAPVISQEVVLPIVEKAKPIALLGDFLLLEDRPWKLVDLRGAEARILFEEMEKPKPLMQPLLWPHEMQLGPGEEAERLVELLSGIGIEARAMGKKRLAIDAVPVGLETAYLESFIQQYGANKTERRLAASLTRICRASSRKFSLEEASAIWRRLQSCVDQKYDPLGRKIVVSLTEDQLAEFFV